MDSTNPTDNTANLQFTANYDNDGNDVAVTWVAFTDSYLRDHQITTYTDSTCSVGATVHPLTGSTTNSDSVTIDGLADGTYYATVTAYDNALNSTTSACSTDSIIVDSTNPTDNTANLQFSSTTDNDRLDIAVTWTAFTDINLSNHRITTYTDSGCSVGATAHALTGSSTNSDSVTVDVPTDGTYYATVSAFDAAGNSTISARSTDSILVDSAAPTDNTANLQFSATFDVDGNDVAVTWTAFTDTNLSNHRITTYTDSACSTGATVHPFTGSTTNSDSATIDGLADGTYYAIVTAFDVAGNSTSSACSTDSIIIDSTAPTDNTANLQFTDVTDADGNNIAVTWTAFTDTNLRDHRLYTYTDSGCTAGEIIHGLTGSNTNSNSSVITGTTGGTYYAKVEAIDIAGNSSLSACSTDSIFVGTLAATKLAITGPASTTAGICSTAFTVEAQDSTNSASNVGADTIINLSGGGNGTFYSDTACTVAISSVTMIGGTSSVNFYFSDQRAESLILNADDVGALTAGNLAHTINPDVPAALVYDTQPSQAAAGSPFVIQPVILINDQYGNLVTTDNSTVITMLEKKNSNCNGPGPTGVFSNVTAIASGGIASFTALTHSVAETVYAKAESGALTSDCSNAILVNDALAISPVSAAVSPSATQILTATGGAGSISFSIPSNNSGASLGTPYTCNTTDTCVLYTAGATNGVDTVRATDGTSSTADSTITISAVPSIDWDASPSPDWGTTSGNVTKTFTLRNTGSATSGTITVSLQDGTNRFSITIDNCSATTLTASATCTVTVNFDGNSGGPKAASDVLDATATPGGSSTLSLTGRKP